VTYLLDGLRALISEGWEWAPIGKGLVAIAIVGTASMSMCFAALRGRVKRG
jgi:ABC-type multidrug transport system permease subunit